MATEHKLPRSSPEAQGISSAAILAFAEAAEQKIDALHSFMLVRHGQVVAEGWWSPYGPADPHVLFSLSKSFTSTAVGLAVAEGLLTVEDRVISFFPDDLPAEVSENLAAMRVHDLLAMATGNAEDTTSYLHARQDGDWVKAFLARPVEYQPGTHFVYNSGATYMLSAIVQKLAGQKIVDYLQPRLFGPLGIENPTWEVCPRGINVGGWGLSIKTEDIARFGQLYLQKGLWHGQQLVPAAWVAQATTTQVDNSSQSNIDWKQGYGYQFWRCQHGAYRGDGAFWQFCVVMPEQDAVLAITSGVSDMQAVLNVVWAQLLPAFGSAPLAEDQKAQTALGEKLASLAFVPVPGKASSPIAAKVTGQPYHFSIAKDNAAEWAEAQVEAISLDFNQEGCILTVRDQRGEHQVVAGNGTWRKSVTTLIPRDKRRSAASGAWTTEDTYMIKICLYETPFCPTITCQFVDDQLIYNLQMNVGFGPTQRPQLVGRRG
ncbi:hypothetical protein BH10CHL1_BH10CHL1_38260 [soil metagenome]